MTAQPMQAIGGQILSPADHMVIGSQLGQAGFNEAEVSNIMRVVEETAFNHARAAARATAMAMLPMVIDSIRRTHYNAAMEIHRQISNRTGGWGGVTVHTACARIAASVAQQTPSHVPPPAQPIVGSVRP